MLSPGGLQGPWQLFESLGPWLGGQWSGKTSITRNGVLRTDLVKLGLEQVTQLLLSLCAQQSFAAELLSPLLGWEAQATFLTPPRPLLHIQWNAGYESLPLCFCLFHTGARLSSQINLFYSKILDPEKQLKPDFRDLASTIPNVNRSLPSQESKSPTGIVEKWTSPSMKKSSALRMTPGVVQKLVP